MSNTVYNKVTLNGTTLIDISQDTVDAEHLLQGYTAHDAHGNAIIGTAQEQVVVVSDISDSHGGIIRSISTKNTVQLEEKEVTQTGTRQIIEPSENYIGLSRAIVNPYVKPQGFVDYTINYTTPDSRVISGSIENNSIKNLTTDTSYSIADLVLNSPIAINTNDVIVLTFSSASESIWANIDMHPVAWHGHDNSLIALATNILLDSGREVSYTYTNDPIIITSFVVECRTKALENYSISISLAINGITLF